MKCIKCNTDNNLKTRRENKGRCSECNHPIVFDTKVMPGVDFTDTFFLTALIRLSANNSLYFTLKQFYYYLNTKKHRILYFRIAGCVFLFIALFIFVLLVNVNFWSTFIVAAAVFSLGFFGFFSPLVVQRYLKKGKPTSIVYSLAMVNDWYMQWVKANGAFHKLLPPLSSSLPLTERNLDLLYYSFDRLVICDRDEIAQILIANNFHFENNCAVLSINKYPQNIFGNVMEMLRRNPDLKVYVLHDASAQGISLIHRLRHDAEWFGNTNTIIYDLGLLPRQLKDRRVFIEQSEHATAQALSLLTPEIRCNLTPEEVEWLEKGKYVDLESFTPQLLLKVAVLGIAKSGNPEANDAIVPLYYSDTDTVYSYSFDTFG